MLYVVVWVLSRQGSKWVSSYGRRAKPSRPRPAPRTSPVWRSCCLSPILTKSAQSKAKYKQMTKPMISQANPEIKSVRLFPAKLVFYFQFDIHDPYAVWSIGTSCHQGKESWDFQRNWIQNLWCFYSKWRLLYFQRSEMADPNLSRPSQQAVGGYEPYQSYSQKSSIPWYHSSLKPFLSSGGSLMPKVLSGMSGRGFILDFSTTLTGEL